MPPLPVPEKSLLLNFCLCIVQRLFGGLLAGEHFLSCLDRGILSFDPVCTVSGIELRARKEIDYSGYIETIFSELEKLRSF